MAVRLLWPVTNKKPALLSTNESLPATGACEAFGKVACTLSWPSAWYLRISPMFCSGTENDVETGTIWLIVTRGFASFALTRLPCWIWIRPA